MNAAIRQRLSEATRDVRIREILTCLYRDHPQGESFEGLKETLFLHEDVQEASVQRLVDEQALVFDGTRYKISADARQVLDRDATILMDKFLR